MIIAMTGATGFIGTHLTAYLVKKGHRVIPVSRALFHENQHGALVQLLSKCEVVINLAGATINRRWTAAYKKELYASRVRLTRQLVQAMHASTHKPKIFISTSAVGYYPTGDVFDEYSGVCGDTYLAELCHAWEREAMKCPAQTRLVIIRLATVLSPDGGALKQMLLPLKFRVALAIGPGTQPFPWVDLADVYRVVDFAMEHSGVVGAVNVVAPQVLTQAHFTRLVGRAFKAWMQLTIPAFVFRIIYGEAAGFLTTGSYVNPRRLQELGFEFTSSTVQQWLESIPNKEEY